MPLERIEVNDQIKASFITSTGPSLALLGVAIQTPKHGVVAHLIEDDEACIRTTFWLPPGQLAREELADALDVMAAHIRAVG